MEIAHGRPVNSTPAGKGSMGNAQEQGVPCLGLRLSAGPLIVVVTNQPERREALRKALEGLGRNVSLPDSLQAAEQILAAHTVPVVVLDGALPDESWRMLLEQIRAMEKPSKIVVLGASKNKQRSLELLKRGGYAIFDEHPEHEEVLALVGEARHCWAAGPAKAKVYITG
jgi:CheY-like chemotaxis protein